MRLPHYLVRDFSGVFHFRLNVPIDLRGRLKLRVIKRSLRTADPRAATLAALTLSSGYAQAFARMRGGCMADDFDVDALIRQMKSGGAQPKKFEIGMDQRGNPTFRSEPGDSLEQTKLGMEQFNRMIEDRWAAAAASPLAPSGLSDPAPPEPGAIKRAPLTPATVRQVIDHWKAVTMPTMAKGNRKTADTRLEFMEDFAAYVGESRTISDLQAADVAAWVVYRVASKKNQTSTVKNRISHIKALFQSAKSKGAYPRTWEPTKDAVSFTKADQDERAKTHGWQAFTKTQLRKLFDPRSLAQTRMVHTRRAMVIALYTGSRVSEIAQMRVDRFPKVEGRRCMSFPGDTKTDAAKRTVPIHPDLIKLGLLQWVAQHRRRKQLRLFPTVKLDGKSGKGNALSKGMGNLLPRLGIEPTIDPMLLELGKEVDPILGMHSFRDTVIQAMQGKVDRELRKAYVGHSYEGDEKYRQKDAHEISYMRDWTPDEIAKVFGALNWGEWLDFDGLRPLLAQSSAELDKDLKTKRLRERTRAMSAAEREAALHAKKRTK